MSKLIREEERFRDPKTGELVFEKCFIPINDQRLLREGIEICATTAREKDTGKIKNRLLFRRNDKTVAQLSCIHTKVCNAEFIDLSPEEKERLGMEPEQERYAIISTEKHPEIAEAIGIEQNFVALKSFIGSIIERGIQNSLIESLKFKLAVRNKEVRTDLSLLDDQTTSQLLNSLAKVNKKISDELVIFGLDYMTGEDPQRMEFFSTELSSQICDLDENALKEISTINGGYNELSFDAKECLSVREDLPSEIATILLSDKNEDIVRSVLKHNTNLPVELQQKFARHKDIEKRKAIANNSSISKQVETILAKDVSLDVQEALIRRTFLSEDTLRALTQSPYPIIRHIVAMNPVTTTATLKLLVDDESIHVRRQLARRENIDLDTVEKLAKDKDAHVRLNLLRSQTLPNKILMDYTDDIDDRIRRTLAGKLNMTERVQLKLLEDNDLTVQKTLARNSSLTEKTMRLLTSHPQRSVRMAIARNPNVPLSLLQELQKDQDRNVRDNANLTIKTRPSTS